MAQDARKSETVRYTFRPSDISWGRRPACRDQHSPSDPPAGGTPAPHFEPGRDPMSRTRIPLSRQEENARLMKERLEMSTAEIGLSVRTTNCLEERGIFTVRDLLHSTPDQ